MLPGPIVALVAGTRPEVIKLAPVYHALQDSGWARVRWIHTGQHAQMAQDMLECFQIRPDRTLARSGTTLGEFSTACRTQLDAALTELAPALCIVQGDTESAFLGALSAFYQHVPVAHVEAGLRTNNLERPFPEEGLRQMISRLAALHFAPTARACQALHAEGIAGSKIHLTGNTVVDAQLWAREHHGIRRRVSGKGHLLVTVHRREHWGADMDAIFRAIAQIARANPALDVLFPVHLNPVVQQAAAAVLERISNVRLVPPLGYLAMQQALADAFLVLTDSGGLQEEAPTYGAPVLVLRDETERPEAVEAGCAAIVGSDPERIVAQVHRLMTDELALRRMQQVANPYGDGLAAQRICERLAEVLVHEPSARAVAA
ncbi:MAG: UDP-N-acetylglucosamine 2-epimerase (non-hydrolyzing) [Comamonadaceae bacterium]|nr:MAG: UDP-N-acetylglucosamine 2-epimerase (non-hydrolyzing) [Comamonadaceae bacterium]